MADSRIEVEDLEARRDGSNLSADMTTAIGKKIAEQVLSSSSESAKSLFSAYGRIDILRPYFDVESKDVGARLLESLRPRFARLPQVVNVDLYGPITLALTLVAVLIFSMKSSNFRSSSPEATLMGTAMASAFGYWFSCSALIYGLSFVFNTNITAVEILSLSGDYDFLAAWLVLGGLAALRMALLLRSRTTDAKQGAIVGGLVLALHLTYLLYLNYGYSAKA